VSDARTPTPSAPLLRPSQLARFWELHPKTVYLWIREGRLAAVRTPGDQFRLRAADVRAFCETARMPLPPFVVPAARRAHVAASGPSLRSLKRALKQAGAEIDAFDRSIDALFAAVASPPALLVLDAGIGGVDLEGALVALRRRAATARVPIVIFNVASAAKAEALVRAGATHAIARGRDRDALVHITEILG
jgi:excisionase family DNA binding protein